MVYVGSAYFSREYIVLLATKLKLLNEIKKAFFLPLNNPLIFHNIHFVTSGENVYVRKRRNVKDTKK